jgi:hypothetical protein
MTLVRTGLAVVMALVSLAAHAQQTADRWTFAVTPYLWLPNVDGTLKYEVPPGAAGAPEVGVGPNDYLQNLSLALMLSGEARKGQWSIITDLVYLDFNNEEGRVKSVNFDGSRVDASANLSTQSSLKGLEWTLAGGYTLVQTPSVTLDLLGGFRYFEIEATTNWQLSASVTAPGGGQSFPASGTVTKRTQLWDGIIGVRGRVRIGEGPWYAPYYLDVGGGSSSRTWQAQLGIAYTFKWGDAALTYRHLSYDQGNDGLLQDFRFSGPALSASFRF